MNKIFYMSIRTQYENLGDYLIARSAVENLLALGDVLLDVRGVPNNYLELFGEHKEIFTRKGFLIVLLKSIFANQELIYVVKPGGYKLVGGWRFAIKRLFILFYFFIIKMLGGKIIRLSHSFESKGGVGVECIERLLSSLLSENYCRDHETIVAYGKIGVSGSTYSEDLSTYFLNRPSCFKKEFEGEREFVSVSLRYDRLDQVELAKKVASIFASRNALKLSFVSQVTFDHELNECMANRMGGCEVVKYDIDESSLNRIVSHYSRSKYVISNRLHSLLLGWINGAIPVAIVDPLKDRKIIGCLNAIGGFRIVASFEDLADVFEGEG